MRVTAERLADSSDPVEIISGATASSGFQINEFVARRVGKLVFIDIQVDVTTATSIVSSSSTGGNVVGDPTIAMLPDGWWPAEDVGCSWDTGSVGGSALISSGGNVLIRTITYARTTPVQDNIRISTCFIQSS